MTPVLKPATRAAAVAGSMVSPSGLTQVMSLLVRRRSRRCRWCRCRRRRRCRSRSGFSGGIDGFCDGRGRSAETVGASLVPVMQKATVVVAVACSESVAVTV